MLFTLKKVGLDHSSRASEKGFELTPSRTLENTFLASRANIAFIIYLYLEKEYISSMGSFLNGLVQYI